jgi:hypothetical protein
MQIQLCQQSDLDEIIGFQKEWITPICAGKAYKNEIWKSSLKEEECMWQRPMMNF